MKRFQLGDIPESTFLKIYNAYDDDVDPSATKLLEPPSDKSKQNRKKKHKPCQTNPLRIEKKQQEWEKEQQKEKKRREKEAEKEEKRRMAELEEEGEGASKGEEEEGAT